MLYLLSWLETSPKLFLPLSVILLFLGTILLVAEVLNRRSVLKGEFTRKIVHIGTGNVVLLAWWFNLPPWIGITASILAAAIALLSHLIPILPSVNDVKRPSLGTFFYAVSIGVLLAYFWPMQHPEYVAIGILVMTWGDGLAAIIGQLFGKHPYQVLGNCKSLEGSLTMLVVSFLVTSSILLLSVGNDGLIWLTALLVAIMATSLEMVSQWGIDNLTVPLGSAALAFLLLNW